MWNKLRVGLEQISDDLQALPLADYPTDIQNQLTAIHHAVMWISRSYPGKLNVRVFIEDTLNRIENMLLVAWDTANICDIGMDLTGKIRKILRDFCEAADSYSGGGLNVVGCL